MSRAKLTIFRKIALSAWNKGGDPSVYGFLELDVSHMEGKASPMPLVIKAIAATMVKHKDLNAIMRFGRIHHRSNIDISVLVNIPDGKSDDLSTATLLDVDKMSIEEISEKVFVTTDLIRKKKDPNLGFSLKLIKLVPLLLVRMLLNATSFLIHDLGLNLKWFKIPHRPFGPVVITNVGSLGINKVLVPLVPWTKAVMFVAIGKILKEPKVIDDKIEIRKIMHLGVTFDHRFFDGSHAAAMIRDFEKNFAQVSGEQ